MARPAVTARRKRPARPSKAARAPRDPAYLTLGIRNHNPGNLRLTRDPWQGLAAVQTDPRFFMFREARWGIRATAVTLITYQDKHKLNTLRKIIARWAPNTAIVRGVVVIENDTASYLDHAVESTGFGADERLDMHLWSHNRAVSIAIFEHENDNYAYSPETIDAGLALAGIEQRVAPTSSTATGVQVATGAAAVAAPALGGIADQLGTVSEVATALGPFAGVLPWIAANWQYLAMAAMAGGLVYALWCAAKRIKEGRA